MSSNSPKKSASPKKVATPKKGTPNKPKTPPKVVQIGSDSSDTSESDSDASSSAEDEMPLSDIKMGKSSPKKKTLADLKKELEKSPASSPKKKSLAILQKELKKKDKEKKREKKESKNKTKNFKTKSADSVPKKRGRPSLDGSSPSKKAKKVSNSNTEYEKLLKSKTI